jgi:diguanylate cyclase (GGDEF)-like protein
MSSDRVEKTAGVDRPDAFDLALEQSQEVKAKVETCADDLAAAISLARRQDWTLAVMFLDLDGFKEINDSHGHAAGDSILKQAAMRLRACIRTSDTACRVGGDEFVVLLPELEGRESAVAAAQKIRARLAVPYVVGGVKITVTASIGVAVYPVDGHDYGDLMRVTDGFMYRDKASNAACRVAAVQPASVA